jgi:thiosulfate/3-mercaptopyruvate sulfurtransferase
MSVRRPSSPSPVVSAGELLDRLGGPDLVLLDVRWAIGRTDGPECYLAAHLPGAIYVDLETELSGPGPATAGRHPLPDAASLQRAVASWGVHERSDVVFYDDDAMVTAARGWWLLRWVGHPSVRVLDGGLRVWIAAGGPTVGGEVARPGGGTFAVRPGAMPTLDAAGAKSVAGEGVLLDARSPERYRGESEPVDPIAGRVSGARNVPAGDNLAPDGRLLPRDELAATYVAAGVDLGGDVAVGTYCGSGVSATLTVLALELLGIRAALFAPSWSGWIADPSNPITS